MSTIIIFIIILGILVFVHEFGHFITARLFKMKVYEFALGFPPRILGIFRDPKTKKLKVHWGFSKKQKQLSKKYKNEIGIEEFPSTLYTFNLLPLGGYCKIKGENGELEVDKDSFGSKPAWQRVIVLAAGVVMNILLAAVLLGVGFIIGLPSDVSGDIDPRAIVIGEPSVIIQQIQPNSPADEAGITFGDTITGIDQTTITNSGEMIDYVTAIGAQEIILHITREDEALEIPITPEIDDEGEPARIGVMLADAAIIRFPWYLAIYKGFVAAGIGLINIFVGFYLLIKGLVFGQGLAFEVAGPVGIAVLIGQSARLGISYLINVTAMISLSLAVINILPIPALDGGRIMFIAIEKIFRKKVSLRFEQMAHTIGFLLLLFLIILVTGRDIMNLF